MKKTLVLLGLAIIAVVVGVHMAHLDHAGQSTVPFTTLAEGSQSKVTARVDYLITTQDQLNSLWDFLDQPPPVPTVDFDTKVVAAVFAGQLPTAGYSIAVAAVADADSRVVKVQLTKPEGDCVLAQSTTAPYQVIELPKSSLPLTHIDTWMAKPCS